MIFFRYDGETFVKEVDVNYIMWEQHGRADYKYSATMKEVLCNWWRVAVDYLLNKCLLLDPKS